MVMFRGTFKDRFLPKIERIQSRDGLANLRAREASIYADVVQR